MNKIPAADNQIRLEGVHQIGSAGQSARRIMLRHCVAIGEKTETEGTKILGQHHPGQNLGKDELGGKECPESCDELTAIHAGRMDRSDPG